MIPNRWTSRRAWGEHARIQNNDISTRRRVNNSYSLHDQFLINCNKTPFPSWELLSGHFASSPSSEGPWRQRRSEEESGNMSWMHYDRKNIHREDGLKVTQSHGGGRVLKCQLAKVSQMKMVLSLFSIRHAVSSRDRTCGHISLKNRFKSLHSHHLLLFLRPETVMIISTVSSRQAICFVQ